MVVALPFNDVSWMNIIDYYFDNVHWNGEERSKYNSPADWVWDKYKCAVDLEHRKFIFNSQESANWFVLTWL